MNLSQNQPRLNPKLLATKQKTAKAKADPKDVAEVVGAVVEDVVVAASKKPLRPLKLMALRPLLVPMSMKT
jgi:hypothetical protein